MSLREKAREIEVSSASEMVITIAKQNIEGYSLVELRRIKDKPGVENVCVFIPYRSYYEDLFGDKPITT